MTLRGIHVAWAWVTVLSNGLVGAWALAAHHRPAFRVRALWPAIAVAQVAAFVQVALGVATLNALDIEAETLDFHILYGFAALFSIGILYGYRSQLGEKKLLWYGLGGLWIMGLGIRAMVLHR